MTDGEERPDFKIGTITESPTALLTALEGADVGIFILGPDFSVQWINEATEEFFGLSRQSVIGKDKQGLIRDQIQSIFEHSEQFAETVIATYEDNSYVEEFECHVLPGEDRSERWLLHRSHPITEGELSGGRIEHYTDITDRKLHEDELQNQNDKLEQFASVVSHDLRNPLNTASLRLELLQDESDSKHIELASDALERMERIIDDMLWLAQTGQDIRETESVRLRDALDAAWMIATSDGDHVELVVEEELGTIEADEARLKQLLENLFSNAAEHAGRDVTVTVGPLADGFYVADDGSGIPESERKAIFEMEYTTAPTGTGFGLSITEEIVDAHGWEINVTDSESGGARFEITGVERIEQ